MILNLSVRLNFLKYNFNHGNIWFCEHIFVYIYISYSAVIINYLKLCTGSSDKTL